MGSQSGKDSFWGAEPGPRDHRALMEGYWKLQKTQGAEAVYSPELKSWGHESI